MSTNGDAIRRARTSEWRSRRRLITWILALVSLLVVAGSVFAVIRSQPPQYQARIGLIAAPDLAGPPPTSSSDFLNAQFGVVVSLGLAAVGEVAHSPSVVEAASRAVSPPPAPADLAGAVSVEYVPGSGVVRLMVTAESPERAAALLTAIVDGVTQARLLAPVAQLRPLDTRPDIRQTSPDQLLAGGMALAAGIVAAVVVFAVRHLVSGPSRTEAVHGGRSSANATVPVELHRAEEPDLILQLAQLQQAVGRPLRVVGVGPGLESEVDALADRLRARGVELDDKEPADSSAVVAVVPDRWSGSDDYAVAFANLPPGDSSRSSQNNGRSDP